MSTGAPVWIDLGTPDPGASARFYGALFGFETREAPGYWTFTHGGVDVAGMTDDATGMPSGWRTYLSVADADDVAERVRDAGGQVLLEPLDVATAGRMAVCTDPQGLVFCLWHAGEHPGSGKFNEPVSLTWNELHTADLAGALAFYPEVFGWEAREQELAGMPYVTLYAGTRPVAGATGIGAPGWQVYFAVEDADATVATAHGLGAAIDTDATDLPGVGRYADLTDPLGASFGVIRG